ncbi:3-phosphoshikimate 1-carboxyvinyltransferase [Stomatobaculum sp. F0698]|uniref:3-phosphoshikimate 1-carboxyvinyltransferase n=1 Tax=Stomatobaculum sp. F0698 TaxID=3059030 RepID=UPI00272D724A|nr:3-phosphoshikimate 1-carboxyvinyltransferase [Stomatobaculum sp. F0698]WLD87490.1 3-phosphoshikimate 1-carboxyvinyltransferase [Stomatobaculum sp. F0698]
MNTPAFKPLRGTLTVSGDKSISHRAVMLGSLATGTTEIEGFLPGEDCLSTIRCFRSMGVQIEQNGNSVKVFGRGLRELTAPAGILDCGNSGTTTRLLSGVLAAQHFNSVLSGDASIQRRPMKRIMIPLRAMGADITSVSGNDCAPLSVHGKQLYGIHFNSPIASAQVKSAVLLAGLYASGQTTVTEPALSRDHTERMLRSFGAKVLTGNFEDRPSVTVTETQNLYGTEISVPGDISSAAFFLVGASIVPGSEVVLRNVGINPTRDGVISALRAMGAKIEVLEVRNEDSEPAADLLVRYAPLHGTEIGGALIPRLIDELPVLAAAAAVAEGRTVIRDAAELKVKESNRIRTMAEGLSRLGSTVEETEDGLIIDGGAALHGEAVESYSDHRIAMSFAILSLVTDGEVRISDPDCVNISAPTFYEDLKSLLS